MDFTNIIGFMAAILTTVSFIPQAVKVIRTKNTEGISLPMYVIFSSGVACWLTYGIMLNYQPMILANVITLGLTLTILAMKIRHCRKNPSTPSCSLASSTDKNTDS